MALIKTSLDTEEKLTILSRDSQYDLACACSVTDDDRRIRSKDDKWIYPVALPQRSKTFLFKTLISNVCANDCKYCPLRTNQDPERVTLSPEEIVNTFFDYYRKKRVQGIFLSSWVLGNPDRTMERLNTIARTIRQQGFRGYMHLKVIPGSSDAAIEDAVSLASTVSLNIETAGVHHFQSLSTTKDYMEDIIRPLKFISALTGKGGRFQNKNQTTQFVVGAAEELDREIVEYMWGLYKRLGLNRVYFSAYQRGLGDSTLPGEQSDRPNSDILAREHRLYQTDFLIRKYKFKQDEIPFEQDGNLSLDTDPKELFAIQHPERFPLNVNKADRYDLLKVPGLGPVTVTRILAAQRQGAKMRRVEDIGKPGKRLRKAEQYIMFG